MKIKIDEPCHENWDEMTPQEKGRFCGACQKLVIDLTSYSDQEVIDFFKEKKYNVCGQLNQSQIDRDLIPVVESNSNKFRKGLIAASFAGSLLATQPVMAQSQNSPIQTEQDAERKENSDREKERWEETVLFHIKGKVLNASGKPVVGALIKINSDEAKTDKNGKFELSLGIYETEPLKVKAYVYASGMETEMVQLDLNFDQTEVDLGTIKMKKEVVHVKGKIKAMD